MTTDRIRTDVVDEWTATPAALVGALAGVGAVIVPFAAIVLGAAAPIAAVVVEPHRPAPAALASFAALLAVVVSSQVALVTFGVG